MFKDREKLYQAYHALLSMALTWTLTLIINQYFELRVPIALSAFFAFIPAFFVYLFDLNRKNVVSYLLILSIIPILALIFWVIKVNPIHWFQDFINWCIIYDGSEELYVANHANFLVFTVALLGSIVFYLLMKKQAAKVLLAGIILAVQIILCVNKVDINKAVVGISIFYILTIVVELYGMIYSRKAGKQEKREGILYLAPICLLLAVISVGLPSRADPIEWKFVKSIYNGVREQMELWKTDFNYYFTSSQSEFFISLSGYSESTGKLGSGDKVVKDSKVALKVMGLDKKESSYLSGSVSDVYTGSSWEKSKNETDFGEDEYFLDFEELFYALTRQDLNVLQNNRFLDRKVIRIEYNNIKTKTFFYPLKTSNYEFFSNYHKVNTKNAEIIFKKGRGKGTSYQSIFYDMNLDGEAFQQMLRDADAFTYDTDEKLDQETAKWIQSNVLYNNLPDITDTAKVYDILGEREKLIRARYTALPEELPERVRNLAEDITKNYDNSYDKLKAIEAYLLGYKYTLYPKKVPEGQDFTDYFLFESKEGYCTSFATAMAVLGRCVGIPTRYVEGFVAVFDKEGSDNKYPVKNSQAHAWAEAYIEGVGWIPFEATAPYYNTRYTQWEELRKLGTGSYYNFTNPYENQENLYPDQNLENDLTEEKENNSREFINGIIIFFAVLVILLITVIIYYYVLKLRYKKTFHKADYSGKMYMLFLRILKLLKREGFGLEQQETILMLAKRVQDRFHYDCVTFPIVANIFMRYRYAEISVTKEDYERVATFHLGLANKQREEESRLKVWLEEFFYLMKRNYR